MSNKKAIEGRFMEEENPWAIKDRLSHEKLQAKLNAFNDEYAGRLVKHLASQGCYRISHFSVLNENSTAEYAVNYHPFDESLKRDYEKIKHTRPAREFFDGRFLH
jgi:hypothetical protein